MKQFRRNVFRLAAASRGSFLGAMMIIALGIFVYVAMFDTLKNLKDQVDFYYEENVLADVFAEVAGISDAELSRLEELPGIAGVTGRMAEDVRVLAQGQEEIVTIHLLSYDAEDEINRLQLSSSPQEDDELYLGARMAAEYGYEVGEPLQILWRGTAVRLSFAGSCYSPDSIYSIPPGGAMVPDGEVYDIACIAESRMEEITGLHGISKELGFLLEPGYTYEEVRELLTEVLGTYGLVSLTSREKQTSYDMVEGEMGELIATGSVLPLMFLAISVFMLYVVLKKMIDRNQSLIGTMKAYGMTDRELMGAYLLEGAAVGTAGALIGSALAVPFGRFMFEMYVDFFNLPDTVYHSYAGSRVCGLLIAVGTGVLAAYLGVRDILAIVPAQAMRARTPASAGNVRLPQAVLKRLGTMERMACRAVVRNPFRGFLIVLAVCFPFSMTSVLFSYPKIADMMFLDQFEKIQMYDLQVSLDRYVSPLRAAQSGALLEQTEAAEAVCTTAAEVSNGNLTEFVMLYGLNQGSGLWKIRDNRGVYYEPPQGGLILNSRMARKLHVDSGDTVEIFCSGMTVKAVELPVVQVIDESFGGGCYMSLDSFEQVFQTPAPANTVLLKAKTGKLGELKQALMETSHVTWLVDAGKVNQSYADMMGSMIAMMNMFSLMAVAAGGILIYNISMINIRERTAEFGTLMVLGGARCEIGRLILYEQLLYFVVGILLGFPGSLGVKYLLEQLVLSESYSINMEIQPQAYLQAFAMCLAIALAAWAAEVRFVSRIRLTDILKERD